ncbi:integrase catalytic domain-containing protein [Trichonephila clavipes]|nr:integrase catalytic domain-containing protein [Trichonephila clavipes]
MPHHGVYRPEKSTTKMRTVFNASSPSTSGKSLNSIQFNGGLVQEDLFSIMVRFRKHKYAFTTDIEKMFRMINIHPEQTCLQRILWKKGIGEPIKTYELTTVTYGTVSAPYLATRTLKQLAMDEANNFPLAAPVVLSDCYMDDILSGSESIEEVIELQHQLIEMFKTAGMHLHKWCGNLTEITSNLQEYAFLEYEETKALGIIWNPKFDCFLFRIEQQRPTSFTKRMVLSTIAKIFDPLGLLGPIITWAKIFMQRLWLLELGWSDELPFKEQKEWRRFIDSLKAVNNISIDRCIVIHTAESIELHAFSDASEKAYGSSIYLKSISALGEVKVCLVTSKSRVSPLKQISIPRLELCGAVLAAKLMKKVKEALNLQITAVHFWSDSTIVISWIHRESRELKTFVANRVSKIHQLSSRDQWHHIASEQNPADVLSRRLLPEELRDDSLWWHGPELLQSTYSTTVIAEPTQRDGFDCELRVSERTLETSLLNSKNFDFFNHLMDLSNNYFKIIHIVSYIYRFIENCRSKVKKRGPLTTSEVNDAETWLIKQDQSGINLSDPSGNLKSLNIFQDDKGILRVGGRLEKASIPYSQKHPAILAKNSKLSKIYFITLHKKLFHVGPQGLLNAVRLRFWALGGRNLARKTVHTCVVCFKCKPIPSSQIMGNLPYERVNMAPPFSITGLDLGGPYFVTYKHQRKGVLNKIYVCVCICFVTRAIHLEILSDLTSDAIIATLKRFMSRRGKCSKIFTDNATNFVGANSQLKVFYKTLNFPDQNLAAYFTEEGIEWNFIPPRAPHMGGLWEAGIKSVKYHLKRALGRSRLTYEEFETVIIQVEGILNSRPLTPISNDFDNFEVLTPAHFLIGRSINSILEPLVINISDNRLSRWQRTTKVIQVVWKKWSTDYLNTLQQRGKWMIEKDNVMCGTMVIVKEDFTPVCNWLLGASLRSIMVLMGPLPQQIGSDFYWSLTHRIKRLDSSLVAVETRLGWSLQGRCDERSDCTSVHLVHSEDESISTELRRFWEIESLGILDKGSMTLGNGDEEILSEFDKSVNFVDGRYRVNLPWKPGMREALQNNKTVARKRFEGLVRRFKCDHELFCEYKDVIDDYVREGIVERTSCDSLLDSQGFYLPHHAVIRSDKTTSHIRIVFDGSAHEDGQSSLNQILYTGPNLHPNILELLLCFRKSPVAFTADVKSAFLQIELDFRDRDFTRFFWTDNLNKEPYVLNFTRVFFGLRPSPYLLAATLKHHFKKYREQYPHTFELLNSSIYVDDLICGQNDVPDPLRTTLECLQIFSDAGMLLRKWRSNSKQLNLLWQQEGVKTESSETGAIDLRPPTKVLGLAWDSENDLIYFDPKDLLKFMSRRGESKRFILSVVGRIFDPIGILGPFVIKLKCLLQELWTLGVEWDSELPPKLRHKWQQWSSEAEGLTEIKIPRFYLGNIDQEIFKCEIHCFSDASKSTYGTILYLRFVTCNNEIETSFICSKGRVAPLKSLTLPRLELTAALLSARLAKQVNDPGEPEPLTPAHFLELGYGDSKYPIHFIELIDATTAKESYKKKKDLPNSSFKTTLETLERTVFAPVKNS